MTKRQAQLLDFIRSYVAEKGYSPSFDEMRLTLGLRSKSGVHRSVDALVAHGKVRRTPFRARSVEVVA